jgi:alkaline phosphatase D
MLDDHEVRDNFGSAPEHSSPQWAALPNGARDAFYDYQASRVLARKDSESSFHYGFVNGPVGVFMMDLRSERRATPEYLQIYGTGQHAALQRFLETNSELPVLAVVVTVPVAHLEAWLTGALMKFAGEGSDIADRWSNPKALLDRNRLLRTIRDHMRANPKQRVIMIGGDIHVGCLFRIDWDDGTPALHQFTSSAISNVQPRVAQIAAEGVAKTVHGIFGEDDLRAAVSLVEGEGKNPYGGLNVGIVEVETMNEKTTVRFKLLGPPDDEGNAVIAYDSGPL